MHNLPNLFRKEAISAFNPPTNLQTRKGLAITGGAASGKSTATLALAKWLGGEAFLCDEAVANLLANDPQTHSEIRLNFPHAFQNNQIQKKILREQIFADPDARKRLENILHPKVWNSLLAFSHSLPHSKPLFVEVPLLFEAGWNDRFEKILLIACSPNTQLERLVASRGLPKETAQAILASQLPIPKKIPLADWVVWNDGSQAALERQLKLLPFLLR
ncbi:MAG: dephospho-CoA kinase [Chthoniobacterales bacterium]|nr:dephospho-CoA kinase [Chthoniobacterales bacterium]